MGPTHDDVTLKGVVAMSVMVPIGFLLGWGFAQLCRLDQVTSRTVRSRRRVC